MPIPFTFQERKAGTRFRILAVDGGGILGVIPSRWLNETFTGSVVEGELFAGSSTGAIVAAALAARMTTAHLEGLYRALGKGVFKDSLWDNIRDLGNLAGARYDMKNLLAGLREAFGSRRLGDLDRYILIPTFDLDCNGRWRAKVQANTCPNDPDLDIPVVDAVARSCAAPTYFQSHQGFIDGSVVATNPTMCAIAEAIRCGVPLSDIHCLSLGTYDSPHHIPGDSHDWGLAQWARPIVTLLMEAGADATDFQAHHLLGERYTRISFEGDRPADLDDVKAAFGSLAFVHRSPRVTGQGVSEIRKTWGSLPA